MCVRDALGSPFAREKKEGGSIRSRFFPGRSLSAAPQKHDKKREKEKKRGRGERISLFAVRALRKNTNVLVLYVNNFRETNVGLNLALCLHKKRDSIAKT